MEEPADELRMTGRITFKDEEMAGVVADGLKACGFGVSKSKDSIALDSYYSEGSDIYFCWQNISEAESTMAIKVIGGTLSMMTLMPFYWPIILPYAGMMLVLSLLVSVIL